MQALRRAARTLEEPAQSEARRVLGLEGALKKRFQAVRARRFGVTRTRIHGDLHLGRLLYTGRDFQFIDFDGPAERPASERRIKRSPLRDVASMMRSFHYIAWAALFGEVPGISPRPEQREALERWARYWNRWVSLGFLREYLTVADGASFVPKTRESLAILLYSYLLEKALQEMAYETQHRPAWVRIPLHGIQQLMEAPWPE
jgi:maltose alpha-D-glucosyltransferase/alpha-amylase